MVGSKRILVILLVFLTAFAVPAQAQFYGDGMGMDPFGQGMGGMQGQGYMYPGMDGMQGQGYMYPGMGMMARQSDPAVKITRLSAFQVSGRDLMSTLENMPQLSLFTAAMKASGYDEKLRSDGKYLVFAPVDKSIRRDLSVKNAQALTSNPNLVRGLVENCIVYQPGGQGNKPQNMTTLNGKQIIVLRLKNGYTANGADVSNFIGTSNGMLIVTDGAVGT